MEAGRTPRTPSIQNLPSAPEVTCAIHTDAKCSVSEPNLAAAALTSPAAASISAY